MRIAELATASGEASAVFSLDLREVFYCAPLGVGADDIWRATRAEPDDPFGRSTSVAQLNTDARDCAPFLAVDGTRIVFASTRPDPYGTMDLWTAVRTDVEFGEPEPVDVCTSPRTPSIRCEPEPVFDNSFELAGTVSM